MKMKSDELIIAAFGRKLPERVLSVLRMHQKLDTNTLSLRDMLCEPKTTDLELEALSVIVPMMAFPFVVGSNALAG